MPRKVFYSFHYKPDNWRVAQIRSIGSIEGNRPAADNQWEEVTKGGDKAIKTWIGDNLKGRSCTIVLVGANTAGRKWINYEIEKSWNDGKGVLGIYLHNLKDRHGQKTVKGVNPFREFRIGTKLMSSIVRCYDPPYVKSTSVYDYIKLNIEEAIRIRLES